MSDRYYALTVILEKDLSLDSIRPIIEAIKMIKNVSAVEGNVSDPVTWASEERARRDLGRKLLDIVFPKKDK